MSNPVYGEPNEDTHKPISTAMLSNLLKMNGSNGFMNNRMNDEYKEMDYFEEEQRKKRRKKTDTIKDGICLSKAQKGGKDKKLKGDENLWKGLE